MFVIYEIIVDSCWYVLIEICVRMCYKKRYSILYIEVADGEEIGTTTFLVSRWQW